MLQSFIFRKKKSSRYLPRQPMEQIQRPGYAIWFSISI